MTFSDIFKVMIIQRQTYNYPYNGRPIKNRIWSIERRHFQWPWTTPTTSFKVTLFFGAEYLRNCCVRKRQTFLSPTCGLQTARILVLWITRSELSCSIVSTTDKSIVWINLNGGTSMSDNCLEQSIFDEAIDQRPWRHRACVRAKGGHFEYSLWTDNVDFVHLLHSMWLAWLLHL